MLVLFVHLAEAVLVGGVVVVGHGNVPALECAGDEVQNEAGGAVEDDAGVEGEAGGVKWD
jgi:hypothetical protein